MYVHAKLFIHDGRERERERERSHDHHDDGDYMNNINGKQREERAGIKWKAYY